MRYEVDIKNAGDVEIETITNGGELFIRQQDLISWLTICGKDSDEASRVIFNAIANNISKIRKL